MPIETAEDLAIFFDPEDFGASAVYHPVGGDPFDVAVIHNEPSADVGYGSAQIVDIQTLQIRRCDVGHPQAGDVVVLELGQVLTLIGNPRLDRTGALWTCAVEDAA